MHAHNLASCTRTKRKFRPAGYVVSTSSSSRSKAEPETSSWKAVTEPELEGLLVNNIEECFRESLRKLVAMGYNAEEVGDAIISCGYKAFPGLVDCGVLNCGRHGENPNSSLHQRAAHDSKSFSSLALDVKLVLNEMVKAVREDRPGLSRADALWCLISAELDVKEAFKVEAGSRGSEAHLPPSPQSQASSTPEAQQAPSSTVEAQVSSSSRSEAQLSPAPAAGKEATSETGELSLSLVLEVQESGKRRSSEAPEAEERNKQLSEEVRRLRLEVEERTEWARAKVCQAAQRLSKDLSELRRLRGEKLEALRVEESSLKRFSDLESALRKTGSQLDQTRFALQKLEMMNAETRAELEAAKLSASESAASSLEASRLEKKSVKKAQKWEKQRTKLQEDLAVERKKVAETQQQLAQAKERQLQAEVRSRQELKAKEEAISRLESEKLAREQAESSARRREELLQSKSDSDLRFYRDEIHRLEQQLARLKSGTTRTPTLAAPFSLWTSSFITPAPQTFVQAPPSPEWPELNPVLRRDRECVMCLCEEMSVVFLPCAHQVVCIKCNELHLKQGMNECPSCRTRIQQRIRVYGPAS